MATTVSKSMISGGSDAYCLKSAVDDPFPRDRGRAGVQVRWRPHSSRPFREAHAVGEGDANQVLREAVAITAATSHIRG